MIEEMRWHYSKMEMPAYWTSVIIGITNPLAENEVEIAVRSDDPDTDFVLYGYDGKLSSKRISNTKATAWHYVPPIEPLPMEEILRYKESLEIKHRAQKGIIQYDTLYKFTDLPKEWRDKVNEYCSATADQILSDTGYSIDGDRSDPSTKTYIATNMANENSWYIEYYPPDDSIVLKYYKPVDLPEPAPAHIITNNYASDEDRPVPNVNQLRSY